LRRYDEKIDKTIIEILYEDERELTFKKLEDRLKPRLDTFSYETYSNRLKQLSKVPETVEDYNSKEHSKYAIQPVLNRRDEKGRGGKVYYSLTKPARIRRELNLPILNSETKAEKAYRILSRSLAFENSPYRQLKDINEYNTLLQKLGINENELQLVDGKPAEYHENLYKVTNLIHQESGIKFSHTEYLQGSENPGEWKYHYQLPGISIKEFMANNNESEKSKGLAYGHIDFNNDDEANRYFKLLENKRLIEKIKSKYLIILNEDRYVFVDSNNNKKDTDRLKEFFRKCWLLHGSVTVYLVQKWKCIQGPTDEERVWYEHLWGKDRSDQIINGYYEIRTKFNKSKNVKSEKEDIQKLLKSQKIGLQRKFKSIKNTYSDIIEDEYSYLANPLLNLVYPQFFRN
jgi:hypothetical protein